MFFTFTLFFCICFIFINRMGGDVYLTVRANQGAVNEAYFDKGAGYGKSDIALFKFDPQEQVQHVKFHYPFNTKKIRCTLLREEGDIIVESITVKNFFREYHFTQSDLSTKLKVIQELSVIKSNPYLEMRSLGKAPMVEIDVKELLEISKIVRVVISLVFALTMSLLLFSYKCRCFLKKYHIIFILVGAYFIRYENFMNSPFSNPALSTKEFYPDEQFYFIFALNYILENGIISYLSNAISVCTTNGNSFWLYFLHVYFSDNYIDMRMFNILLSCGTLFFIYQIANFVFQKKIATLAVIFCCFEQNLIDYSYSLLSEPLFFFLLSVGVYIFLFAIKDERMNNWKLYIAGGMFALLGFTRSIGMLLPIFIPCILFLLSRKVGEINFLWKKSLIVMLCALALIFPMLIKNYCLFGIPSLSIGSGVVLYYGTIKEADGDHPFYRGMIEEVTKKLNVTFEDAVVMTSEEKIVNDKYVKKLAVENIKEDLFAYVGYCMKRIARLTIGNNFAWFWPNLNYAQFLENNRASDSINKLMQVCLVVYVYLFAVFYLYRFIRKMDKKHVSIQDMQCIVLVTVCLYFMLFSIPFMVLMRYGLPVFLLATIFASAETMQCIEERAYKEFLTKLGVVVLCIAYICTGY